MRSTFSKKQLAVACALALGIVSGIASAQAPAPVSEHALVTTSQGQVWMNGYGECWHSAFGPPPAPNAVCGPQPVAQYVAPAPAPVVLAAAAPQPVHEKVAFDADTLFDFDKSVLRPAGRDTLDAFVKNMQGVDFKSIVAVGHTDRLGSTRYNQNLSEERVAAVKTYLISKGIESGQLRTSGMGETQPMTKAGQCRGSLSSKLIACLQTDRRVEIEVSGSRLKQ
jgi:OmpA-OmpF porin, OOP family